MDEPRTWMIVGLLIVVAVGSAWFALTVRANVRRRQMKRRFRRGRQGEQRAAELLRQHGYEVLEDQLQKTTGLWIDGDWREVMVRADYLARRRGRTFVVEVKTGGKAPDPTATATRRQLFEYHHVYQSDGLILADMETNHLFEIRFPDAQSTVSHLVQGFGWRALLAGSLAGLVVGGLLAASILR